MASKRIGLDLDGVCYQWEKTARYMLREILPNSPYTKDGPLGEESNSWDYIEQNVSKEHWRWLWDSGIPLGLFRHGHLYPGTIKAVRELAKFADVIVCTARHKSTVPDTCDWLAYQRLPVSGIHIMGGEAKSTIKGCDVWIDDKPENCADLLTTGATVCMPDRPWNRHDTPPGVIRVTSWDEFVKIAREAPRVKR